jgi:hypothetical protein
VDRLRALLLVGALSAAALSARGQGAGDIESRTITLVNALYQATDDADRERLAGELGELYRELLGAVQSSGRADERTRRAFVLAASALAYLPEDQIPVDEGPIELLQHCVEVAGTLERLLTTRDAAPGVAASSTRGQEDQEAKAKLVRELGERLIAAGRYEQCRALGMDWLDRLSAPRMRPRLMLQLATASRLQGRWDDALRWLDAASETVATLTVPEPPSLDETTLTADICGERGQVHLDLGKTDRAAHWFEREREALPGGAPIRRLNARLHEIGLRIAQNLPEVAVELASATLQDAELLNGWPSAKSELLVLRGIAELDAAWFHRESPARGDDLQVALADPHLTYATRLRALLILIREAIERSDFRQAREQLTEVEAELAGHSSERGFTPFSVEVAALQARWARKSGAAPDELRSALARLRAAYEQFLGEWSATPLCADGVGFLFFSNRRRIVADLIATTLAATGSESSAFEVLLRAQAMGSFAREHNLEAGGLADIRRDLLSEGEGLLVYLPAREEGHVFAVDRKQIVHASLRPAFEVAALRRDLFGLIADSAAATEPNATPRITEITSQLAAALLPAGIADAVRRWSKVTIVGADLFVSMPFEILPAPDGGTLGTDKAVCYLPSIPIGLALARQAHAAPGDDLTLDLCLVAAPTHGEAVRRRFPDLPELPFGAAERAQLCDPFDPARVAVFTGALASAEGLASHDASRARVLHLLTHGVYVPDEDRPAGLVLAATALHDGVLLGRDVEALHASPLVILSACGTGRAPLRQGDDGVNGLAGAFLRAGARAVVLSNADIDYRATLALMAAFHEHLRLGDAPAEALRKARAGLSADVRHAHPGLDSLIYVSGLGHTPLFARQESDRVARGGSVAAAVVLLLALTALIVRRRRADRSV